MAKSAENQVIQSKIRVPSPEGIYLKRDRLESEIIRFITARKRGVILCTAPVGYGKSFLFSKVCAEEFTAAWFLAEPFDNTPGRFLSCAAASLEQVEHVPALIKLSDRLEREKLTGSESAHVFIKHFETYTSPFLWIIDEAQHVTHKFITDFLQETINHLPPRLFLILISRTDLPFRLTTLRLQELLLEIRAKDLRLTFAEAVQLFTLADISFTQEQMKSVHKKTEGWFACLKLFILAWKQMPVASRERFLVKFGGTHRFITDYLFENISQQLSPRTMHFLYATSVAGCFTPDLCSLLSGIRDCTEQLDLLKAGGLLYTIRYAQGKWYRYHHLLKDFLQMKLTPQNRLILHTKAADWFQAQGFPNRAQIHRAFAEQLKKTPGAADINGENNSLSAVAINDQWELTRREQELLRYLEPGLTNKEIGEKLFISEGTVKWHLNNIFLKIGAKNRTEAIKLARNSGII